MSRPPARPGNPFRPADDILVIAHRGGAGLFPENTLHAFRQAAQMGADVMEIDIHQTADGHLVVAHDPHVDRVTDGSGLIKEHTLAELQALDAGYRWTRDHEIFPFRGKGCTIPTLLELYEALPDHWINIDIKQADPPIFQNLADFIRRHGVAERTMVGSFHVAAIEGFRRACPEVATAASVRESMRIFILHKLFLQRFYRRGVESALQIPDVHEGFVIVTPRFVKTAHQRGLAVHVWTVNDKQTMHRLIDMGVDGIVTDFPDRLLAVKAERSGR
ncbi:MAG: glycerophosphodiester phosphodiesterase [Acidobacteriota bacterium]|nr:glycerophosphodiester phosphodiesterase [Acidobacteriota bacterium]